MNTTSSWPKDNVLVQVLEQNSCFPLSGHYACQCVLFLVDQYVETQKESVVNTNY